MNDFGVKSDQKRNKLHHLAIIAQNLEFKGLLPGYITLFDKTIQNQQKHMSGGVLRYSIAQNVCVK